MWLVRRRRRRCLLILPLTILGLTTAFITAKLLILPPDVATSSVASAGDVYKMVHSTTSLQQNATSQAKTLSCDEDCQRFRQLVKSWPSNDARPCAVIYYLVQRTSLGKLNTSIRYLDANFNKRYQYPVIVFVEPDLDNVDGRYLIRSFTDQDAVSQSRLFIQVVRFSVPSFVTRSVPKRAGNGKPIGYRHMCRFHSRTVYEQPTIGWTDDSGQPMVQYAWRMDDDSFFYRTINYDPIAFMAQRKLLYGYIQVRDEAKSLIRGLWEAADKFLAENPRIPKTEWFSTWKHTRIFYNNFEISAMSVWTSAHYKKYIDYIDHLGGIYYLRWGDAPIKTIAVTLFVNRNQTYLFKNIAYKHNIYHNKGRG